MSLQISREICLVAAALVLVESCQLSAESGPYPWTVRVMDSSNITVTHGSLIRADKVLSICSPYKDLPANVLSKDYMMVGYNFKENCESKKKAKTIVMAENCTVAPEFRWPLFEDFALWTVLEFFQFDENFPPFLWGGPNPPVNAKIRALIDFLRSAPDPEKLKIGLFKNSTAGSELQTGAEIEFISWKNCGTDILMKLGQQVPDAEKWAQSLDLEEQAKFKDNRLNYTFFCGIDMQITWNPGNDTKSQPEFDWYSGAAVLFEEKPGQRGTAIGMISRAFTVDPQLVPGQKNFRLISGFHQGLYDLLKKSGVVPLDDGGGTNTMTETTVESSTEPLPTTATMETTTATTKPPTSPLAGEPSLTSSLWIELLGLLSCLLVKV